MDDVEQNGTVEVLRVDGLYRACFDGNAAGNCTTPFETNEIEIGTGITETNAINIEGFPFATAITGNTSTTTPKFIDTADGIKKRLRKGRSTTHTTTEIVEQLFPLDAPFDELPCSLTPPPPFPTLVGSDPCGFGATVITAP